MALRFQPVDSDESSEEEEEDEEEEDEERRNVVDRRQWFEDSSEEEDETRVVRSQKDKRWGVLQGYCAKIKNKLKIQDYVSIFSEFEELNRQLAKSESVIQTEGIPIFYTRTLVRLEDAVAALTKENQKKLSSNNAKSFNKLKSNLKKHNKLYEEQMIKFRANPIESEESSESEEEEEEKPKVEKTAKETKKATKKKEKKDDAGSEDDQDQEEDNESNEDEEDDDDDDEWGEGSESDDENDDVEDRSLDPQNRRAFWVIKEGTKDDGEEKKEKKKTDRRQKKEVKEVKEKEKEELFTTEVISAKLQEIIEQRSKRVSNTDNQIQDLKNLLSHCKDVELALKILNLLLLFEVENSKDAITVVMSRPLWLSIYNHINQIVEIYTPKFPLPSDLDDTRKAIIASLAMRVERLSNELTKAFKYLDAKSSDYSQRLADNISLSRLNTKVTRFYQNIKDSKNLVKLAFLSIYQVHYIHDDLLSVLKNKSNDTTKEVFYSIENTESTLDSLMKLIFKHGEAREKVFAALMVSYHHALHSRYEKAKSLFLQANTATFTSDLAIQVFTNRLIVQIGLSAFYNGNIEAAFKTLNEIVSTHRLKELLAQTISINKDKSTIQERDERKRAIPYHMHMNTDVIETVYFICAMIIDIPKMAMNPQDPEKHTVSKYFKKLMDFHERQASSGLTEGFREFIIAAAQKLRRGYWKEAYDTLAALDTWNYVPRQYEVKKKLLENLKETGMIIYILTYGDYYENFSKKVLSNKFEIDVKRVEHYINLLILSGELQASWDGEFLILQGSTMTRVEFLVEKIKDKVHTCYEASEKLNEFQNFLSSNQSDYSKPVAPSRKKKIIKKIS